MAPSTAHPDPSYAGKDLGHQSMESRLRFKSALIDFLSAQWVHRARRPGRPHAMP